MLSINSKCKFIRILDRLSNAFTLQDWIPINGPDKGNFKIVMENEELVSDAVKIFMFLGGCCNTYTKSASGFSLLNCKNSCN